MKCKHVAGGILKNDTRLFWYHSEPNEGSDKDIHTNAFIAWMIEVRKAEYQEAIDLRVDDEMVMTQKDSNGDYDNDNTCLICYDCWRSHTREELDEIFG